MKCPKCNANNPDTLKFCGECGTQLPSFEKIEVTETLETPKEELTTGSTFAGRYQIIEELGKGGMGRVYKVLDKEVNAKVALKLIKPEIASDKKTIERFRNELKVARDIAHKNVCRMYDLGKEEGAYYITMEYVSGEDLKSFIRRSGLISTGKAISIARQVCEGLLEAHRLGVVHRDLKPQNIMIDKEGNARIMDFGIARSLRAKGITGSGVMIGTPEYMSPEQVDGKEADQRADIYSLGVILYEMVTGRVPFEGDTPFSIGVKQKSEVPRPPIEINDQITEDLNRVILKCMEKEKESRYQSVDELRSELTGLEKGIPTTERIVPERKPLTSREITVQFSLKRLLVPVVVMVAVVLIGFILWQILPKQKAPPLAPSGKPSLAVMYFENNTGDEGLDHWRKAIAELLITDLSQSKYIKVLSRDRLYNILDQNELLEAESYSSEDLKKIANRGGVNHILQGGYAKADNTYRVNYSLQNMETAEIIGSDSLEGEGEKSIFSMVDELTNRIKTDLKLSQEELASDFDKNIGEITTSSPEAYKYFSEGIDYEFKGNFREAIRSYKKAIEIDPEFALAHNFLGFAYGEIYYYLEGKKCHQKAFELRDHLSEREKLLVEADYYSVIVVYDKAIEAYKKLLAIYPEDWAGNIDLGSLYRILEQWDKAIERFEVLKQNKDDSPYTYANLSTSYMAKGLFDKSREVIEYYINNFGENILMIFESIENYLYQGKLDLALSEAEKSLRLDPTNYENHSYLGDVFLYKGELDEAEKEYIKLLGSSEKSYQARGRNRLSFLYLLQGKYEESKDQMRKSNALAQEVAEVGWKAWSHNYLGWINLLQGNLEEARIEFTKATDIAYSEEMETLQRDSLFWKASLYAEEKNTEEANKAAEEFKKRIEEGLNKKAIRRYYFLKGMIEIEEGNFSEAIEYIEKGLPLTSFGPLDLPAWVLDNLAFAQYSLGNLEKARIEYERITKLTTGRRTNGNVYAKSFYMLGKICEEQGNTSDAFEYYEKFLDLWKNADPWIAEIEDAKKRLAGLKGT